MVVKIDRILPGELEGDIDPRHYGFEIIEDVPPSEEEQVARTLRLYKQARDRTGVTSPKMERILHERPRTESGSVSADESVTDKDGPAGPVTNESE